MSGMHRDRVETKDRPGLHERFRLLIQLASAALVNGYAAGFAGCKIFTGTSKMVCLPVLNCYSCPGALGACPIGSLQAVEGGAKHNISFYVLGTLVYYSEGSSADFCAPSDWCRICLAGFRQESCMCPKRSISLSDT